MKQGTLNFIFLGIAVLAGISMFLLKYHVLSQEKELMMLRRHIMNNRRELHLLRADWAVLTDPQHLRKLIQETSLKPFQGKQIITPEELQDRSESLPSAEEDTKKNDV